MQSPLLHRTTRSVTLTPEGEALLTMITPLLAGLEAAVAAIPSQAAIPSGEVVLACTADVGRALVAPALTGFRARYPAICVHVVIGDVPVDLARGEADLALRVGRPGGTGFVARKLGDLEAGFFASPAYLQRRSAPKSLSELSTHERLWPVPAAGQRPFLPSGKAPAASIACSDFALLAELARCGGGIALLPSFVAARDVALGALLRVLPSVSYGGAPLYLVSRSARPMPARIAALRSYLLETSMARGTR